MIAMKSEYVQTIAEVDQIQAGLKENSSDAEDKAVAFLEKLASLPSGKYMLLEGYKLVVLAMANIEDED